MNRFLRNFVKLGVPILVIIIMMVWLSGVFHRGTIHPGRVTAAETSSAGIAFYTVSAASEPQVVEAVGTVQPQFKTTVSARITANVVELPVSAGQHVRSGDMLVRLDDRDLRAKKQQAQEALRRAEATRDLAQSDYTRDKALFEKAVIPKSEFDETTLRLPCPSMTLRNTSHIVPLQLHELDLPP